MAVSKKRVKKNRKNTKQKRGVPNFGLRPSPKMIRLGLAWAKDNAELASVMRERLCLYRFLQRIEKSTANQTDGKYAELCANMRQQFALIEKDQISSLIPYEYLITVYYHFDLELNRLAGRDAVHLLVFISAVLQLIYEMQERVPERHQEPWLKLDEMLNDSMKEYEPIKERFEADIDKVIDGLMRYIWNEEWIEQKDMTQPTVYLVRDSFLVAARSRAEVKECTKKETGLILKSADISGLALGYKFEKEVTVAKLVSECPTIPYWIGKLGEAKVAA
jgi:hypothetical protein